MTIVACQQHYSRNRTVYQHHQILDQLSLMISPYQYQVQVTRITVNRVLITTLHFPSFFIFSYGFHRKLKKKKNLVFNFCSELNIYHYKNNQQTKKLLTHKIIHTKIKKNLKLK